MEKVLLGQAWLLLLFISLLGSVTWCIATKAYTALSRKSIFVCVIPGMLVSLSFYALAMHMHSALEGWPKAYGYGELPPSLVRNAKGVSWYFGAMLLGLIFVWPVALILCSVVSRLRRFFPHLSLFAGSLALNFTLTQLGPSEFLRWWWD